MRLPDEESPPGARAGSPEPPGWSDHAVDALLPAEIARKAEAVGAQKARLDPVRLFVLAVLAGAFIALGAMFATTVMAGAEGMPFGISRLLGGLVFALGLILVVLGGAELFTGNTLMVMALAARRITLAEMLRAWGIVLAGNFVGAIGTALLVFLSGQYLAGGGAVAESALGLAVAKVGLPFGRALFLGILCNVLVCLAVWMSLGARSAADKVLAILFPVSAFVAAGFEHSVANMYIIPLGMMIAGFGPEGVLADAGFLPADLAPLTWAAFLWSLVPVTIGNVIGGGVLVGAVYWFVYLRHEH
ncbi:formate/nitrite transporter family protein [Faunimonas sp. B44]|uniref:formate/nitrite transporter family protein n=1 Tax=Faunimonas sp. B44 TaxID=3461493 RepID=UPI004043F506